MSVSLKALLMSASEADTLVKGAGGDLKSLHIETWTFREKDEQPTDEAIPYRLATRADWDAALQSVAGNAKLETIEFTPHWPRPYGLGERDDSLKDCTVAALDALCAILGDLPLSLKKISVATCNVKNATRFLNDAHVRAFMAAPCVVDGACELDVEICKNDDCHRPVQNVNRCCVCEEQIACIECLNYGRAPDPEHVLIRTEICGRCARWRCHRQACWDVLDFSDPCKYCEMYWCNDCMDELGKCGHCDTQFCYAGPCKYAHKATCSVCDAKLCRQCVKDVGQTCDLEGCDAAECSECFEKLIAACEQCDEKFCRAHNEVLPCRCVSEREAIEASQAWIGSLWVPGCLAAMAIFVAVWVPWMLT